MATAAGMDLDPHALPESLNLTRVFLERQVPAHGDRPALFFEDQVITYRQLSAQVDRAVAVLRGLGLRMEERVLLMLPDVPQFASAWFAVVKAGGVVAAVSPDVRPEEAEYYCNYTRARIAVAHASALPALESVRHACPHLQHVLVVGGDAGKHLAYDLELERAAPDPAAAPTHRDDACAWLFTSGSTGFPKGAVHKQHDFVFNALTYALPIIGYGPRDVCAGSPKLAFGYALGTNLLFPLLAGGAGAIFSEKSTPERVFAAIQRFRPTVLTAVPTSLNAMVNSPEIEKVDFSSLRACLSAGEALPAELYGKWKAKTGVEIYDGIGSAEMFHIFVTNRPGDVKVGSLGKVVEGYEARICDDDGRELPRGDVGTLWIRGDSMALEYWQQHEKSKQTFRGDWCVSADKFRQDDQGYFFFCGRGDDMLKVGGKWLSPVEVENALLQHPAVREAAVIGFKDADGLEKPKAFVVLNDGHAPGEPLAEELKAHVRGVLAPFKAPRVVLFVDGLPKSDRGKVLKSALRG
ncbi:MAG TPA: benzoate-CoA ligase family protein [Myxococcales bacterium]|nr:benzoate-CoA ligase family protein [Myxococcales bacterium]